MPETNDLLASRSRDEPRGVSSPSDSAADYSSAASNLPSPSGDEPAPHSGAVALAGDGAQEPTAYFQDPGLDLTVVMPASRSSHPPRDATSTRRRLSASSRSTSAARRSGVGSSSDVKGSKGARGGGSGGQAAFLDFLWSVGRVMMMPITYPLSLTWSILSSPLTISLTLRAILLLILLAASGVTSAGVVLGFWVRYGGGVPGWRGASGVKAVEVEGWFTYGSKLDPVPNSLIRFKPYELFRVEDAAYDVEVELELVRSQAASEMGNFMITLDFMTEKNDVVRSVSQPCLPALPYVPAPLLSRLMMLVPRVPSVNPLKLLSRSTSLPARRRHSERASKDTYLLTRPMVTGPDDSLVPRSSNSRTNIAAVKVRIGREDVVGVAAGKEVMTTGWVVVRFLEKPRGIRWLFVSHPIIPLLVLPPIALAMTLVSALTSFVVISWCLRVPVQDGSRSVRVEKMQAIGSARSAGREGADGLRRRDGGAGALGR